MKFSEHGVTVYPRPGYPRRSIGRMTPLTLLPGEKPGAYVTGPAGKVPIPVRYVVPVDADQVERDPGPPRARALLIDSPGDRGPGVTHGHRVVWPARQDVGAYEICGFGVALEETGPLVAIWPILPSELLAWQYLPGQELGADLWHAEFAGPLTLTAAGRHLVGAC